MAVLPARFPQQAHFSDEKTEAQRVKQLVQGQTADKRDRQDPPLNNPFPMPLYSTVCADLGVHAGYMTTVLSSAGDN